MAISLRAAATGPVAGMAEPAVRALAKLEQVLPSRLRHRVTALQAATVPLTGPADGDEAVDPALLAAMATACRDHRRLRLRHRGRDGSLTLRTLEPHRLVHTSRRRYLLAWDVDREDWRTSRVDRFDGPPGARFTPRNHRTRTRPGTSRA